MKTTDHATTADTTTNPNFNSTESRITFPPSYQHESDRCPHDSLDAGDQPSYRHVWTCSFLLLGLLWFRAVLFSSITPTMPSSSMDTTRATTDTVSAPLSLSSLRSNELQQYQQQQEREQDFQQKLQQQPPVQQHWSASLPELRGTEMVAPPVARDYQYKHNKNGNTVKTNSVWTKLKAYTIKIVLNLVYGPHHHTQKSQRDDSNEDNNPMTNNEKYNWERCKESKDPDCWDKERKRMEADQKAAYWASFWRNESILQSKSVQTVDVPQAAVRGKDQEMLAMRERGESVDDDLLEYQTLLDRQERGEKLTESERGDMEELAADLGFDDRIDEDDAGLDTNSAKQEESGTSKVAPIEDTFEAEKDEGSSSSEDGSDDDDDDDYSSMSKGQNGAAAVEEHTESATESEEKEALTTDSEAQAVDTPTVSPVVINDSVDSSSDVGIDRIVEDDAILDLSSAKQEESVMEADTEASGAIPPSLQKGGSEAEKDEDSFSSHDGSDDDGYTTKSSGQKADAAVEQHIESTASENEEEALQPTEDQAEDASIVSPIVADENVDSRSDLWIEPMVEDASRDLSSAKEEESAVSNAATIEGNAELLEAISPLLQKDDCHEAEKDEDSSSSDDGSDDDDLTSRKSIGQNAAAAAAAAAATVKEHEEEEAQPAKAQVVDAPMVSPVVPDDSVHSSSDLGIDGMVEDVSLDLKEGEDGVSNAAAAMEAYAGVVQEILPSLQKDNMEAEKDEDSSSSEDGSDDEDNDYDYSSKAKGQNADVAAVAEHTESSATVNEEEEAPPTNTEAEAEVAPIVADDSVDSTSDLGIDLVTEDASLDLSSAKAEESGASNVATIEAQDEAIEAIPTSLSKDASDETEKDEDSSSSDDGSDGDDFIISMSKDQKASTIEEHTELSTEEESQPTNSETQAVDAPMGSPDIVADDSVDLIPDLAIDHLVEDDASLDLSSSKEEESVVSNVGALEAQDEAIEVIPPSLPKDASDEAEKDEDVSSSGDDGYDDDDDLTSSMSRDQKAATVEEYTESSTEYGEEESQPTNSEAQALDVPMGSPDIVANDSVDSRSDLGGASKVAAIEANAEALEANPPSLQKDGSEAEKDEDVSSSGDDGYDDDDSSSISKDQKAAAAAVVEKHSESSSTESQEEESQPTNSEAQAAVDSDGYDDDDDSSIMSKDQKAAAATVVEKHSESSSTESQEEESQPTNSETQAAVDSLMVSPDIVAGDSVDSRSDLDLDRMVEDDAGVDLSSAEEEESGVSNEAVMEAQDEAIEAIPPSFPKDASPAEKEEGSSSGDDESHDDDDDDYSSSKSIDQKASAVAAVEEHTETSATENEEEEGEEEAQPTKSEAQAVVDAPVVAVDSLDSSSDSAFDSYSSSSNLASQSKSQSVQPETTEGEPVEVPQAEVVGKYQELLGMQQEPPGEFVDDVDLLDYHDDLLDRQERGDKLTKSSSDLDDMEEELVADLGIDDRMVENDVSFDLSSSKEEESDLSIVVEAIDEAIEAIPLSLPEDDSDEAEQREEDSSSSDDDGSYNDDFSISSKSIGEKTSAAVKEHTESSSTGRGKSHHHQNNQRDDNSKEKKREGDNNTRNHHPHNNEWYFDWQKCLKSRDPDCWDKERERVEAEQKAYWTYVNNNEKPKKTKKKKKKRRGRRVSPRFV